MSYELMVLDELERNLERSLEVVRQPRIGSFRPDAIVERADRTLIVFEVKYVGSKARDLHFSSVAQAAAYVSALESEDLTHRVCAVIVTNRPVSGRLKGMANELRILVWTVSPETLHEDIQKLAKELSVL